MSFMIARVLVVAAGAIGIITWFTMWQQDVGGDKREWEIVTRIEKEARKRDDKIRSMRKRVDLNTVIERLWNSYGAGERD